MTGLKRLALIPLAVLVGACHPNAPRAQFPRSYMDTVLVAQAAAAGIQYRPAFVAASERDSGGLATLFRATLAADGVGADQHSQILWEQLQAWGDSAFASVLRVAPDTVRKRVRCALDYAACQPWAVRYPSTASLAPEDSHCVCR